MFDPYRKWLGILPKDQPPNHYRLLSLELFENDLDVIEGAADRQMSFVRQYQSGENATDAAKILNELAIARLCLLKPATKAAYDEKLRKRLAPPPVAAPEPDFPDLPFTDADLKAERAPRKQSKKKSGKAKASGPSLPLMMGVGAVACLLLVVFLTPGRKPGDKPDKNASANSGSSDVGDAKQSTGKPQSTSSNLSTSDGGWSESKLAIERAGDPIDLLKSVELPRNVVYGDWKQTTSSLIGSADSHLYLPGKLPEDYQLKFAVRRIEGADTLIIGFMMAGRQGMLAFDGWGATISGLCVDGREPNSNGTARRGKLFNEGIGQIVLTVHPGHLHATFDGRTIIDWHGDPERLSLHYGLASRESAFIAISKAKYVIESASLIPIKPEPAATRPTRLEREIDVVPLFDTERDSTRGIWSVSKNVLFSPDNTGYSQIYLPTIVPEEYTLSVTVEMPANHQGDNLVVGLLAGKSCFLFNCNSTAIGLELIDGRRWNENETRMPGPLLAPGSSARLDFTVTKSGIRTEVDGRTIIDWSGDVRRLLMPGDWPPPDGRRLFLGAMRHFKFRDIKLGPPLPVPKRPEHPPLSIGKPLDLLTVIDAKRDGLRGTWERDGTSLQCKGDLDWSKLAIPFDPPEEYKLTMRVARTDGGRERNEAMLIHLPLGRFATVLGIDGKASRSSGIYADNVDADRNRFVYRSGPVIPPGVTSELVMTVQRNRLRLAGNGNTVIDWSGNSERWTSPIEFAAPGRWILLGSWNQGFRFEKLDLEPLPPTTVAPVRPLGADGRLLPIIDVDRDARRGDWKLDADGLTCPKMSGCRLRIPVDVPPRYTLSATVERKQANGDVVFGLLVGGRPCSITIDGNNSTTAGIDLLDGKRYFDKSNLVGRTYKQPLLPPNKIVHVRCVVLPDTIVVSCGDKEIVRWHGDSRRLSPGADFIPPNFSEADRNHLWLGGWDAEAVFRDLELKPLSDAEAEQMSKSFSGVFPTTSQGDLPLAAVSADSAAAIVASNLVGPLNLSFSPSVSQSSKPAKTGEWVDLLEWSEGVDWAPRGINWNGEVTGKPTRDGITLIRAQPARFPLPAIIDGDYEMEAQFTRRDGNGAIAIHFPVGMHTMHLLLGHEGGSISQFEFVDGKIGGERRPGLVSNNQLHRVFIRVRHAGDKSRFSIDWDDIKDYLAWEGASDALTNVDSSWNTTMLRHVWIGSYDNNLVFQKVRVRMSSGTIRRDVITAADRTQDLNSGFVRLVGEKPLSAEAHEGIFSVNQLVRWGALKERRWPRITEDFKFCDDFYAAPAPSRLKCPIPKGAKAFSVVGYNCASGTSKFLIEMDGKQVFSSRVTNIAMIKVDIPVKATFLELIADPDGDKAHDHVYWCFPRFHSVDASRITDAMLDDKPGPLNFSIASSTVDGGTATHNQPIGKSHPVHFRNAIPCEEFIFAHAPSSVAYSVPEGMARFTAIGYTPSSDDYVKYEVWADGKRIYESPEAGIIQIDAKLPVGTKKIELKINHLGNPFADHSYWCYPRLLRE